MARPRPLDRISDGDERIPAALIVYRFQRVERGEPPRPLGPGPHAAVLGRRLDPLFQRRKGLRRHDARLSTVVGALVAETIGTTRIVASDQLIDPTRRERQQLSYLVEIVTLGQQPQRMKMALGDRIACRLVALQA